MLCIVKGVTFKCTVCVTLGWGGVGVGGGHEDKKHTCILFRNLSWNQSHLGFISQWSLTLR